MLLNVTAHLAIKIATAGIVFLSTGLVTQKLNTSDQAVFFSLLGLFSIFATFLRFGTDHLLVKKLALAFGERRTHDIDTLRDLTIAVPVCLSVPAFFCIFGYVLLADIPIEYSIYVFAASFFSAVSVLAGFYCQGISRPILSSVYSGLVSALLFLFLIILNEGNYVSDFLFLFALSWSGSAFFAYFFLNLRFCFYINFLRNFISESYQYFFVAIFSQLNIWAPLFLATLACEDSEITIFGVALRSGVAISFAAIALSSVTASRFSKSFYLGDKEGIRQTLIESFRFSSTISCAVFLFIIFFGDTILEFFHVDDSNAMLIFVVMSAIQCLHGFFGPLGVYINVSGNPRYNFRVEVVGLSVAIVVFASFSYWEWVGYISVLISFAASVVSRLFFNLWFVWRVNSRSFD
jgi:O-antigen/teichoic acid export membrane protein